MKSITKAQYAMLFFAVDRLKEDSWHTGPYGFDALKERGLVDFGQHDRIITDEGIAFVKRMLADPESMPMTAKRAIAEYDVLRDEYAHLFEHDPDMRVRVAMFGVHGLEPVEPPTGIDGFRTDTIYDFKDLDVLSATFAITHLYSGFNPNHHVIVRAHESYTDPPARSIDSINNRQLRQSGGTRYLKVSRTVLDKENQLSVERIIVETNDETGNNPVEYDWEFDPDGTFHMSGDGEIPSAFEESAAIVDAFNHVNMSIVNGERTPLKDGDRSWFTLLAVTLATLIPFVEGKDGHRGGVHDGRYVKRLQRQYHVGGVPGLLPLHVDRRRCPPWIRPISELPLEYGPRGVGGSRFRSRVHRGGQSGGIHAGDRHVERRQHPLRPHGRQGGNRPTVPSPVGDGEMRGHPGPIRRRPPTR